MKKQRRYILICWLGLLMAMPVTALAEISSQQASDIARQHVPGRVLAVKQVQHRGRMVYQIKLLSARGEVHIILIDASSGKHIGKR